MASVGATPLTLMPILVKLELTKLPPTKTRFSMSEVVARSSNTINEYRYIASSTSSRAQLPDGGGGVYGGGVIGTVVAVAVGGTVAVAVAVGGTVAVAVAVGRNVGVAVGDNTVDILVAVAVGVAVAEAVVIGVFVAVAVAMVVDVAVAVGTTPCKQNASTLAQSVPLALIETRSLAAVAGAAPKVKVYGPPNLPSVSTSLEM